MMATYPETALEKIFQKVEEESERRAQKTSPEYDRDVIGTASMRIKERRRGSISISRFGQLPEALTQKDTDRPPASILLSVIASKSTFYQVDAANGSVGSFASAGSTQLGDDLEDNVHVTRVQQIVGRRQSISRAIGSMLPRKLSRARSSNALTVNITGDANVVIGVSVEESIVDVVPEDDEAETSGATVYAPGALRSPASSTFSMSYSTSSGKGWVTRAKDITQKFRRRSRSNMVGDDSSS